MAQTSVCAGLILISGFCLGASGQSPDCTTNESSGRPRTSTSNCQITSGSSRSSSPSAVRISLINSWIWVSGLATNGKGSPSLTWRTSTRIEFKLVIGGGYEYLRTLQAGKNTSYENRLVLEAFPGFRPASRVLIRDRNRVEFNWTNGVYSTVYRSDLSLEYDIKVGNFRLTPYASAEVFYDGAKHSWNEEQYTAGIQWPYKRLLMLQTYYLRQNCTTCSPAHLNIAGLTLNFYLRNRGERR